MRILTVLIILLALAAAAPAEVIVETFEGFPAETVLTTQIPGLTIAAPPSGTPTVLVATSPTVPGEPNGLAHIPYFDYPDYLLIDFYPTVDTVGAIIDFGAPGEGVRLTAYDGPGATGNVLGTAETITEIFISVEAGGIVSARFETLGLATYLIDNLTYQFDGGTPAEVNTWGRTKALYR